jgi:L,D-transpeptidase ErfK/SrfK
MKYSNSILFFGCLLLGIISPAPTAASEYILEDNGDTLVGEIRHVKSLAGDSIPDIARRFDVGYKEVKLVNPNLETWMIEEGEDVVVPLQFVLPQAEQTGLVLNIPEMRLYYFPQVKPGKPRTVYTYPLGIGRQGWQTPYAKTRITGKVTNPSWTPTASVRKEHAEEGDILPRVVGPGPNNPLGSYAMYMGLPSYLIHGTNKPYGVGMRVSHGCIRLYPEDIEALFPRVGVGTQVNIVNQPYKVGIKGDRIYLEAHPSLDEDSDEYNGSLTSVVRMLVNLTQENGYEIDWKLAQQAVDELRGVPVAIGRLKSVQEMVVERFSEKDSRSTDRLKLRMENALP